MYNNLTTCTFYIACCSGTCMHAYVCLHITYDYLHKRIHTQKYYRPTYARNSDHRFPNFTHPVLDLSLQNKWFSRAHCLSPLISFWCCSICTRTSSFSSRSLLHLKIRIRMSYDTTRGGARLCALWLDHALVGQKANSVLRKASVNAGSV